MAYWTCSLRLFILCLDETLCVLVMLEKEISLKKPLPTTMWTQISDCKMKSISPQQQYSFWQKHRLIHYQMCSYSLKNTLFCLNNSPEFQKCLHSSHRSLRNWTLFLFKHCKTELFPPSGPFISHLSWIHLVQGGGSKLFSINTSALRS